MTTAAEDAPGARRYADDHLSNPRTEDAHRAPVTAAPRARAERR